MSLPPPLNYATPQFSGENLKQLAAARAASRKIRRAVSVASFDGWTIAACGALTIGLGLGDVTSIAIGVVLGAIAFVELRSAAQLKRLKVEATRTLALNQLALATLLIVYAVWRLYVTSRPGALSAELGVNDPDVASMLGSVEDLTHLIMRAVYGGLIAIAVFAQGGLAWYYFTRTKHLKTYLAETPAWIITLQEQGVAL
ncbi:MAG TPA: hypothetical protein VGI81_20820 [Tepidisphaeraceae bacterium]|jgi:hypothetical protein